mgnify:CR=1 FL=1
MDVRELIINNRSYRRFYGDHPIDLSTLYELTDLARLSASARNDQPLKYILSCDPNTNEKIFSTVAWAGFLKEWNGPVKEEQPVAYIVMLHDINVSAKIDCDHGIAAQSILLGAVEKGLGGCILGSVKKDMIREKLTIDPAFEILQVIALGKPKENVVLDSVRDKGDTKYWRDNKDIHHVPKRELEDIIVATY